MFLGTWAVIILLVILIAIAIGIGRRGMRSGLARGRAPRPRHVAVRIICGALGAAILVAVAIGTIREVNRCYEFAAPLATPTVLVPTKPALLPDVPFKPGEYELTRKTRILVTLVATEFSTAEPQALAAKMFDIAWPQDKGRTLNWAFKVDATEINASVCLQTVTAYRDSKDGPELISRLDGSWEVTRRSPMERGSSSGSGAWLAAWQVPLGSYGAWRTSGNPLSIAQALSLGSTPALYCFVTPVAADDPLKEAPLTEFVASRRGVMTGSDFGQNAPQSLFSPSAPDRYNPVRGFALADCIGVSSLLLLLAAVLLTQVFTHRALVFPAILTGVILYVAALDRTALGMHLARLDDAKASAAVRTIACVQATETFFYGKTALERIDAVAKDEASPKELKALAAEAAKRLQERMKS